jgi:hypothetical protein
MIMLNSSWSTLSFQHSFCRPHISEMRSLRSCKTVNISAMPCYVNEKAEIFFD